MALVHVVLEWQLDIIQEGMTKPDCTGLGTDEAFRLSISAVKDYAILLLDKNRNITTWNIRLELIVWSHEIIDGQFSTFHGVNEWRASTLGRY